MLINCCFFFYNQFPDQEKFCGFECNCHIHVAYFVLIMTHLRWQCLKFVSVDADEIKALFSRRASLLEIQDYVWQRMGWQNF